MTPDKVPSPLPPQCALDRSVLARIDTNVTELTEKFNHLVDIDGPISGIKERMALVEASVISVHGRVDATESDIVKVRDQSTGLALKVGTITALLSSGFMAAVIRFFGGSGG